MARSSGAPVNGVGQPGALALLLAGCGWVGTAEPPCPRAAAVRQIGRALAREQAK